MIVYYDKEKKRHIEGSFLLSMSIPFTFSLLTGWPLRQEPTKNLVCGGIHLLWTPLDLEFLVSADANGVISFRYHQQSFLIFLLQKYFLKIFHFAKNILFIVLLTKKHILV